MNFRSILHNLKLVCENCKTTHLVPLKDLEKEIRSTKINEAEIMLLLKIITEIKIGALNL